MHLHPVCRCMHLLMRHPLSCHRAGGSSGTQRDACTIATTPRDRPPGPPPSTPTTATSDIRGRLDQQGGVPWVPLRIRLMSGRRGQAQRPAAGTPEPEREPRPTCVPTCRHLHARCATATRCAVRCSGWALVMGRLDPSAGSHDSLVAVLCWAREADPDFDEQGGEVVSSASSYCLVAS